MKAILYLEDGKSFVAQSNIDAECLGEVIINTAVVGYQEMITDPANIGKILVLTYPLIGNYGVAPKFSESFRVWVNGLVVKEVSNIYSNWQAKESLNDFLKKEAKPVISGLDTRSLTVHLRENGPLVGIISTQEFEGKKLAEKINKFKKNPAVSNFPVISVKQLKLSAKAKGAKIAVLDLGITNGLIKQLEALNLRLNIFPYFATAKEILAIKPKGLLISNGPENDPELIKIAANVTPLIGKLPILGVVTGCQVLALALGAKLTRLKFGHRGGNYPICRTGTFKGDITVQNHEYVIENNSLRKIKDLKVTAYNLNDHTIEEIESKKKKIIGVQYTPVSAGFSEVNPILIKFNKLLKPASVRAGR